MEKESNLAGPHTLLRYPANLEDITGKPTGQGFDGTIEAVVDADYPKGNTFATNLKDVKNIGVK